MNLKPDSGLLDETPPTRCFAGLRCVADGSSRWRWRLVGALARLLCSWEDVLELGREVDRDSLVPSKIRPNLGKKPPAPTSPSVFLRFLLALLDDTLLRRDDFEVVLLCREVSSTSTHSAAGPPTPEALSAELSVLLRLLEARVGGMLGEFATAAARSVADVAADAAASSAGVETMSLGGTGDAVSAGWYHGERPSSVLSCNLQYSQPQRTAGVVGWRGGRYRNIHTMTTGCIKPGLP